MCVLYFEANNHESSIMIVLGGSIIAALFTMLDFAIEPKKHMRNYRKAYSEIYGVMLKYEIDNNKDGSEIVNTLAKCEKCIDASYDVDYWCR